ncbi:MAG: hypothetical protein ACT4OK_10415 [Gemmobacter sp.]
MPIIPANWRTRPTTPEQKLAAAILAQAFKDMFGGAANDSVTRDTVDTIAITAMRYLTARHGQSAQWRNKWASYLDLDGDVLAVRVRMILEGQLDLPGESRLAVARARWASIVQHSAPSDKPKPLPTIKAASPPAIIDPVGTHLTIPDDPFFVTQPGHIRASRRWKDGEVSRLLGPLPSMHSHLGDALWQITQSHRAGAHSLHAISCDGPALIDALRAALPTCEIGWTSQGKRLPEYQPKAGLRVYLKQLAEAA